ncbi:MAG TPA: tetratricopeptide repeat protein [Methylomirabilota bacterium]|nr:tetratricopeptide repeat protein [Methylomirabilota bacterium]
MRTHVLIWLLAGAALPATAAAQSVADHVAMGVTAMQAHDLRTGLAHYEAALADDSTSYEANWRAAMALLDLGEQVPDEEKSAERDALYARAETLARRAVLADSTRVEGHFALAAAVGRASLTMGKKERIRRAALIRDEARRAIAIDSTYDGAYHVLGRWHAEIMRLSGFSRFFAKSFLGAGVFKEASWDSAVANLEKAVALDPRRIYHRLELAQVYADRKRYDEARAQLAEVESLPERELQDSAYKREAGRLAAEIAGKR